MDENTLFRSAFNGFKREDVMEFITKTAKQNEAAIAALREELEQQKTALDAAEDARRQAEEQLSALQEERDALAARCEESAAQLAQQQETVDSSQSRISAAETARKAAEAHGNALSRALEETRASLAQSETRRTEAEAALAGAETRITELNSELDACREDANGYASLAQQVGRTMLHAEVAGETLLTQAQAQADALKQSAEEESAATLAAAAEKSEAMLAEAQNRVAQAQAELEALIARKEETFARSHAEYVAAQDAVNSSVQRAMDELEEIRSRLLGLSDHFNDTEADFDQLLENSAEDACAGAQDGE